MMKAAPSVVSPLQPNDSGSQISKSIDLPPVARGLKLLSRVGLRFAQNALKTDHGLSSNVENSNATILVIFKHCEYIACNDKIINCRVKKDNEI